MTAGPTREIAARAIAVGGVLGTVVTILAVGPDPIAVLAFAAGCVSILIARIVEG